MRKYLHQRLILTIKIGATQVIKEAVHLLDKISMPFISTLIGLQLVPPWRFTGGFAANIYGIKEDFDKNINLLSESKKAKGYNSFAAYNFLVRRRKELLDQGYETFRREFFRVLDT